MVIQGKLGKTEQMAKVVILALLEVLAPKAYKVLWDLLEFQVLKVHVAIREKKDLLVPSAMLVNVAHQAGVDEMAQMVCKDRRGNQGQMD